MSIEIVKEFSPLSASKIKTLESCTYSYYCQYVLKIPQLGNMGSSKGTVVHLILEMLIKDKRQNYIDKILAEKTIRAVPSIYKLAKKHMKINHLPDTEEIFDHIDRMTIVGLSTDFKPKDCVLIAPEYAFDIKCKDFRIKGFMDKVFFWGKDRILIDDYKTSKQKYKGEELSANTQALMYSYVARQIWPDRKPYVRFIFLQFPKSPLVEINYDDDVLGGFADFLSYTQKRVDEFNYQSALAHIAADFYTDDGSFGGKIKCGNAKTPEDKKKDGSPAWFCPWKFPIDFWEIRNDKNEVVRSHRFKEEVVLKDGETVKKKKFLGCIRFRGLMPNNSLLD